MKGGGCQAAHEHGDSHIAQRHSCTGSANAIHDCASSDLHFCRSSQGNSGVPCATKCIDHLQSDEGSKKHSQRHQQNAACAEV